MKTYTLTVAGVTRDLPVCPVNEHLDIAGFVMLGDIELTTACAAELAKRAPEHDVIITAEAKGIPVVQEMARILGDKYFVCCRKGLKLYMQEPVSVDVKSITTEARQKLWIDECDAKRMRGKRVLVVDDVISTGESLAAIEKLVTEVGGNVCGRMCVLAEGDAKDRDDIIYLEELPLFFK